MGRDDTVAFIDVASITEVVVGRPAGSGGG